MILRSAEPQDLPAIRALHEANWRRDYAPLLPAKALDQDILGFMGRLWQIGTPALARTLVVVAGGTVAGFGLYDPDRDGGLHIASLHVDAAFRGQGVGRKLMAALADRAGAGPLWLEVLMGNHAARTIYRHWGGVESAAFRDEMLGAPVESCKVTWADPVALSERLGQGAQKKERSGPEGA